MSCSGEGFVLERLQCDFELLKIAHILIAPASQNMAAI
jgi:hypothetical protein